MSLAVQSTRSSLGIQSTMSSRAIQSAITSRIIQPARTTTLNPPAITTTPNPPAITTTPNPPAITTNLNPPARTTTLNPPAITTTLNPPAITTTLNPPARTTTLNPPSCSQTYTANENETCDSIGSLFGLSGADILAANTFLNCNDIWKYTPVCIPSRVITIALASTSRTLMAPPACSQFYSTNGDETCDSIGAMFGISGGDILAANRFLNCNDIWQYTRVCIPVVGVVTGTSPTAVQTVTI